MADLTTSWLGLTLASPLVVSASPLSRDPEAIARAVEACMKEPALQAKFRANRMTPVAASQAQTVKLLADFRAKWEPVVKASGFRE